MRAKQYLSLVRCQKVPCKNEVLFGDYFGEQQRSQWEKRDLSQDIATFKKLNRFSFSFWTHKDAIFDFQVEVSKQGQPNLIQFKSEGTGPKNIVINSNYYTDNKPIVKELQKKWTYLFITFDLVIFNQKKQLCLFSVDTVEANKIDIDVKEQCNQLNIQEITFEFTKIEIKNNINIDEHKKILTRNLYFHRGYGIQDIWDDKKNIIKSLLRDDAILISSYLFNQDILENYLNDNNDYSQNNINLSKLKQTEIPSLFHNSLRFLKTNYIQLNGFQMSQISREFTISFSIFTSITDTIPVQVQILSLTDDSVSSSFFKLNVIRANTFEEYIIFEINNSPTQLTCKLKRLDWNFILITGYTHGRLTDGIPKEYFINVFLNQELCKETIMHEKLNLSTDFFYLLFGNPHSSYSDYFQIKALKIYSGSFSPINSGCNSLCQIQQRREHTFGEKFKLIQINKSQNILTESVISLTNSELQLLRNMNVNELFTSACLKCDEQKYMVGQYCVSGASQCIDGIDTWANQCFPLTLCNDPLHDISDCIKQCKPGYQIDNTANCSIDCHYSCSKCQRTDPSLCLMLEDQKSTPCPPTRQYNSETKKCDCLSKPDNYNFYDDGKSSECLQIIKQSANAGTSTGNTGTSTGNTGTSTGNTGTSTVNDGTSTGNTGTSNNNNSSGTSTNGSNSGSSTNNGPSTDQSSSSNTNPPKNTEPAPQSILQYVFDIIYVPEKIKSKEITKTKGQMNYQSLINQSQSSASIVQTNSVSESATPHLDFGIQLFKENYIQIKNLDKNYSIKFWVYINGQIGRFVKFISFTKSEEQIIQIILNQIDNYQYGITLCLYSKCQAISPVYLKLKASQWNMFGVSFDKLDDPYMVYITIFVNSQSKLVIFEKIKEIPIMDKMQLGDYLNKYYTEKQFIALRYISFYTLPFNYLDKYAYVENKDDRCLVYSGNICIFCKQGEKGFGFKSFDAQQCEQYNEDTLIDQQQNDPKIDQKKKYFYYSEIQIVHECALNNALCSSCKLRPSFCLECAEGTNRVKEKNCQCADGFFNNDEDQCEPCHPKCKKCIEKDKCIECKENRINNPPECPCPKNYLDPIDQKEKDEGKCEACDKTCISCDATEQKCICPDEKSTNRKAEGRRCPCKNGYYGDSDSTQACKLCFFNCETCKNGSEDQCYTCKVSKVNSYQKENVLEKDKTIAGKCQCKNPDKLYLDVDGLCSPYPKAKFSLIFDGKLRIPRLKIELTEELEKAETSQWLKLIEIKIVTEDKQGNQIVLNQYNKEFK